MKALFGIICVLMAITQLSECLELAQENWLNCVTNYWLTINCNLDSRAVPTKTENSSYWLEFYLQSEETYFNCSLKAGKGGFTCSFNASLQFQKSFLYTDKFTISLCSHKTKQELLSEYYPSKHIKPITPSDFMLNYTNGSYNFKWNNGYEKHPYGCILPFLYNLTYCRTNDSVCVSLKVTHTNYSIEKDFLAPRTEYIAKVRTEMTEHNNYRGQSSSWSTEIRWKTSGKAPASGNMVILICVVVLCFLLIYPVARNNYKRIKWPSTPTPYFQPFNQIAQAKFQDFKGHMQHMHSEETSSIDMITEICYQIGSKDQEQISTMFSSTQCHTPYVGPSMEVWFSCPKSGSQTSNKRHCTNLDVLTEDDSVEVPILCLSTINVVKSLVCMEDLNSSQPLELLVETQNPAGFAQNYCTLTNTANGLIPTFPKALSILDRQHSILDPTNIQTEQDAPEMVTLTLDSLQLCMEE